MELWNYGGNAVKVLIPPFHYSTGFSPAGFVAADADNHTRLFWSARRRLMVASETPNSAA